MRLIENTGTGCLRRVQATSDAVAAVGPVHIGARALHGCGPAAIAGRRVPFMVPGIALDGMMASRGGLPSRRDVERRLTAEGAR
jgi:hypothetical protein